MSAGELIILAMLNALIAELRISQKSYALALVHAAFSLAFAVTALVRA